MTGPGPIAALLDRWWRRAHDLTRESRRLDDYDRGELKGRAKGIADCARELEDIVTTVNEEQRRPGEA